MVSNLIGLLWRKINEIVDVKSLNNSTKKEEEKGKLKDGRRREIHFVKRKENIFVQTQNHKIRPFIGSSLKPSFFPKEILVATIHPGPKLISKQKCSGHPTAYCRICLLLGLW